MPYRWTHIQHLNIKLKNKKPDNSKLTHVQAREIWDPNPNYSILIHLKAPPQIPPKRMVTDEIMRLK